MSSQRAQYLQALQIPEWRLRKPIVPVVEANKAETAVIEHIAAEIKETALIVDSPVENRSTAIDDKSPAFSDETVIDKPEVFQLQGQGNIQADCLVLGNIAVVDETDFAFTDEEKVLLTNMLKAIGLTLDDVFTVQPLACLATLMRDPQEAEVQACKDYLIGHINKVKPKVVLVMNTAVAEILLDTQQAIAQLTGKIHDLPFCSTQVIVTYSPAHLLKKPADKRTAWEDLKQLKRMLM